MKNWGYPYRTPKDEDITDTGWHLLNDEENMNKSEVMAIYPTATTSRT